MLTAAAVCPHPPLLIPAAIGAAASDPPAALRAVRDACDVAVHALAGAGPDLIAVIGGGPADREYDATAAGSLSEFGVPVTVGEGEPVLPLSLTVGRWLLGRAGIGAGAQAPGHGPQVLLQAVEESGLDVAQARSILQGDTYAAQVREEEAFYTSHGIHAVPSVIVNDRHLIQGGQPPEVFAQALRQIAAEAPAAA